MRGQRGVCAAALAALFLALGAGVASAQQVTVAGAGATFPAPVYQDWIDTYKDVQPNVALSYEPVGSGEGIRRFIAGTVDFGGSDRAMSDEQIAEIKAGVQLIPATAGMVVVAFNLPGVHSLNLSREVLVDIFNGTITDWDDERIATENPGVDLPAWTLVPVVRLDSSGTTFAFTNHLAASSPAWSDVGTVVGWPGRAMRVAYNEGVAQRIRIGQGAIGYVGYEFASRLGLGMAALQNQAGNFVAPSAVSGQAALAGNADDMPDNLRLFIADPKGDDAYPIVTYSWLMLYERYADQAVGDAVRNFVVWSLTDGQPLAEEIGYIPLPAPVQQKALAKLGLSN